jgi:hemerythrin superfamily protein
MKTSTNDAITILVDDHKKVKGLFEKFDALSDRSTANKKKVSDQICRELTVHTEIEEQLFYPAVRGPIKDGDMMDEAIVEHASAKELISEIRDMDPGDDLYDAKIKVLSEQIEHHVEEEETEMFPEVRKSKIDLVALGEQMGLLKQQLEAEGS